MAMSYSMLKNVRCLQVGICCMHPLAPQGNEIGIPTAGRLNSCFPSIVPLLSHPIL